MNKTEGQELIPEGFYIIADDDDYFTPQHKDSIIINIKELISSNYHSDKSRLKRLLRI
ncbi:hypothetical protein [Psychrobacillus psychrodurans]|uniref:hypothetical protein n=1 Tax=Psychrobacillus psychrodurans TaxID=126157 RepID=UPI0022B9CE46|nr:hypothetical protein [Psychrobacillus psychrodurans]MCZ8542305.1 hypothetical protein [Psychrobacillus psychrodurans]